MGARRWSSGIGSIVALAMILGRGEGAAEATAASTVPEAAEGASNCHSRADCGSPVKGGLRITFTGWSCSTGFVARDATTRKGLRADRGSLHRRQRPKCPLVPP